MPTNVGFQIPFLGGGPSIAEQVMQGLHEGFLERQQKAQLGLEQQRVQNETSRNTALNQLTQAQIQHESNVTAFENETNPIKKQQLLQDLNDSALKLGIAKNQAKYFGIDADALIKSVQPGATGTGTSPTPQTTSTSTSTGATISPFLKEMQRTEQLLGPLNPNHQAIWDNAKDVAQRTMSAAPITAALAKISEDRQQEHKQLLETTPFKTWHDKFVQENNREPTAKEVQDFTTAGAQLRLTGMENLRQDNYLDTTQPGGGTVSAMTAGEFAAANKAEPGRFVKDTGQVRNAIKATSLINDIRDGVKQMRDANAALPDKGLTAPGRALLSLAAKSPENAVNTVMAGLASTNLSEQEQNYLIAHATLVERAMALRSLQGQGAGSDTQRAAIVSMLPGFATADKKMVEKQLKTFENNVANVDKSIPRIGQMSRQSAGEAAPQANKSGLTPEQEAEQFLNPPAPKKP